MSKKAEKIISIWGNRRARMRDANIILTEADSEAKALSLIKVTDMALCHF